MPPYCSALEEMSKKHYLEWCWFVQKHANLDLKDMFHNHKFVEKISMKFMKLLWIHMRF